MIIIPCNNNPPINIVYEVNQTPVLLLLLKRRILKKRLQKFNSNALKRCLRQRRRRKK
jgi:hypothetical protein